MRWILASLHWARTGRMPEPLEDYPPLVLRAVWDHLPEAVAIREAREAAERAQRAEAEYDRPRETGDPEIDRWEREIAAGRTPKEW